MERTYVIPLRQEWQNVPNYKRARRSVVAIKKFLARHMKIRDRDLDKIKLDVYLNNEVWFRGGKNPPTKIKVKASMKGDNVMVELADVPEIVRFAKTKHERKHRKSGKKAEEKAEEKKDEKTEEQKKEESEKEKSSAIAKEQLAEQQAKTLKHTTKVKTPKINRMALKK